MYENHCHNKIGYGVEVEKPHSKLGTGRQPFHRIRRLPEE